MPEVILCGRFAVISSSTEYKKAYPRMGWKRVALLEIDPTKKAPSRIDTRIKAIKRILLISEDFGTWRNPGFFMWRRECYRYRLMAEKFDRLYPMHFMAKEWPLKGFDKSL